MAESVILMFVVAIGTLTGSVLNANGLELGSVAAWFSGLASSFAIWIALSRNHQIDSQREQDRLEKKKSSAYQAYIKLDRLIVKMFAAHHYLRTSVVNAKLSIKDKDYMVSYISDNPSLASLTISRLSDAEANIFAEENAIDILDRIEDCFDQFEYFQVTMKNLRSTQLEIDRIGSAKISEDGRVVVEVDVDTPQVRNLVLDAHHNYGAMCAIVSAGLKNIANLRAKARDTISSHFGGVLPMSINEQALKEELDLGLPDMGLVGQPRIA